MYKVEGKIEGIEEMLKIKFKIKPIKSEFSKLLMAAVMLTYFIVLVVGIYVVLRILDNTPEYSVQALVAMFSFNGGVVGVAIGFYMNKSTREKHPQIPARGILSRGR